MQTDVQCEHSADTLSDQCPKCSQMVVQSPFIVMPLNLKRGYILTSSFNSSLTTYIYMQSLNVLNFLVYFKLFNIM